MDSLTIERRADRDARPCDEDAPRAHGADAGFGIGLALVLVVAIAGVALTVQGWRTRIPAFDLLTYVYAAHELLESGSLPRHGDTGSYGSLKPPGTAWLMVPSALLLSDPRLSEYVGTAVLHVLTLLGLFLLARTFFGNACAYLAVVLYGLSAPGLFLAGSLWPNGRPDVYVWLVYCASQWVLRASPVFLAAAVGVWAVGMHVDMAHAPAAFIFPVLWLVHRPPIRFRSLLAAVAVALLVWSPYLTFQAPRAFADMRSQLLLQNIAPVDFRTSWCDPSLSLQSWDGGAPAVPAGTTSTLADGLASEWHTLGTKLRSNFTQATSLPGVDLLLAVMTLVSLGLLSARRDLPRSLHASPAARWILAGIAGAAAVLVCVAILVSTQVLSVPPRVTVVLSRAIVLLVGASVLVAGYWYLGRWSTRLLLPERVRHARILALCLGVPWLILLVVAEAGKPERFWWLFPVQVVFLAALFTTILPSLAVRRPVIVAGISLLVLVLVANTFSLSRVRAWWETGWTGTDADEVQVAAFVANHLGPERREAAIGYRVFVYPFMAGYNVTNPIYKVGADIDILFTHLYGIQNTNRCAEGFAPHDELRIVQTAPKPHAESPRSFFDVPLSGDFRLLESIGTYQVWVRT